MGELRKTFLFALCAASLTSPAALADSASEALLLDRYLAASAPLLDPAQAEAVTLSEAQLEEALTSADWRVRQQAALALGWRQYEALFQEHAALQPLPTRIDTLRMLGSAVADERLTPLYLERLLRGDESLENRLALADILPRSGGDWTEAAVTLLQSDEDPALRAMLAACLRYGEAQHALPALRNALATPQSQVRLEAARALAWRSDGAQAADELEAALADDDAELRATAARALGYLGVESAFTALTGLLEDADAAVRLQAVNALGRLDAPRAASLSQLRSLEYDEDPRVARAAKRVR